MYIDNAIHAALADLLRFEEQRLGLPIEGHSRSLTEVAGPPAFRPVIEVNIHTSFQNETFPVRFQDELLEIRASIFVVADQKTVGFTDRNGTLCPLAGVTGNRLNVYFDLNRLFFRPEAVRRKPLNGSRPTGNPANKLAELILSQALPIIVGNIRRHDYRQEDASYVRLKLQTHEQVVREWQRSVRDNEQAIQDKTWEISNLARKNGELRERIYACARLTRKRQERQAREECTQLRRLLGRSIRLMELRDGHLNVLTHPIDVDWCGYAYEFGCFWLRLPLGNGRVEIRPEDDTYIMEGYPHPHISTDGTPCLGNIGASLAQLLGEGKIFEAVTLLLEFLRSYNPDNPYLKIERWHPDFEDEDDRFEDCYSNASLSDCATCNDHDCPYHDGARQRCLENTDTEDCIECAGCDLREDAVRNCRESHEPFECVTCGTSCPWAGNARLCRETHDGDQCNGCPNDDCNHYIEEDSDEEQDRQLPAVSAAGG